MGKKVKDLEMVAYLDNNSTTRMADEVFQEVRKYQLEFYGNPNSPHGFGMKSWEAIEKARTKVAKILNTKSDEIFFTSCATESINIAIRGVVFRNLEKGGKIIISNVEHKAVLETVRSLSKFGFTVVGIPVDERCVFDLNALEKNLDDDVILVSLMHVNNEVGTVEPIEEAVRIIRERTKALIHIDGAQSIGKLHVDLGKLDVDLFSFSAHKFHGPKGMGVLFKRRGVVIETFMTGGGQEKNLRSGTQNVPGIVGTAVALELVASQMDEDHERMENLRTKLLNGLKELYDDLLLITPIENSVVNTLSVSFKGLNAGILMNLMSEMGVFFSTGSACSGRKKSHVLKAMGFDDETILGSVRLSLSRYTAEDEIDNALDRFNRALNLLRN